MALSQNNKILVVGAGAFGTAIASSTHSQLTPVTIVARDNNNFGSLKNHSTLKYCKMETFESFTCCFEDFSLIILAIPCQSLRNVSEWMQKHWLKTNSKKSPIQKLSIISAAKGIEQKTLMLPSQILESIWKENAHIGTLSGPSFAKEILLGLPTCVVVASQNEKILKLASQLLHNSHFRIYESKDTIGVEIAGALKML